MTTAQKWRKLVQWLKSEFPTRRPVSVRQVKTLGTYHGDCCEAGGRYTIRINARKSYSLRVDTLLHEWAHARTWLGNDTDDHGEEWSLAFGTLYREFVAWDYGHG